jgi:hypothetical protein
MLHKKNRLWAKLIIKAKDVSLNLLISANTIGTKGTAKTPMIFLVGLSKSSSSSSSSSFDCRQRKPELAK